MRLWSLSWLFQWSMRRFSNCKAAFVFEERAVFDRITIVSVERTRISENRVAKQLNDPQYCIHWQQRETIATLSRISCRTMHHRSPLPTKWTELSDSKPGTTTVVGALSHLHVSLPSLDFEVLRGSNHAIRFVSVLRFALSCHYQWLRIFSSIRNYLRQQ